MRQMWEKIKHSWRLAFGLTSILDIMLTCHLSGLSVHLNQVHKEQLNSVENALPNRQGLEVEIFGMEGIPDDVMQTHNTRVMQQYYEAAAERRAKSGNLMPGETPKRKKIKLETEEELKERFLKWRENGGVLPEATPNPAQAPVPAQNPAVQVCQWMLFYSCRH